MPTALVIPTERPGVHLERMTTDADYSAWLMAKRTVPSDFLPEEPLAPDHEAYVRSQYLRQEYPDWIDLGIWDKGQIRGVASLYPSDDHVRAAELAYVVAPKDQRHGYGTLAVKAALDYAMQDGGYEGVFAEVRRDNSVSQRMLTNMGFSLLQGQPGYLTYGLGSVEDLR